MPRWTKMLMILILAGTATPSGALASQPCHEFSSSERARLILREVSVDDEVVDVTDTYDYPDSQFQVTLVPDGIEFVRMTTDGNEHVLHFQSDTP